MFVLFESHTVKPQHSGWIFLNSWMKIWAKIKTYNIVGGFTVFIIKFDVFFS